MIMKQCCVKSIQITVKVTTSVALWRHRHIMYKDVNTECKSHLFACATFQVFVVVSLLLL